MFKTAFSCSRWQQQRDKLLRKWCVGKNVLSGLGRFSAICISFVNWILITEIAIDVVQTKCSCHRTVLISTQIHCCSISTIHNRNTTLFAVFTSRRCLFFLHLIKNLSYRFDLKGSHFSRSHWKFRIHLSEATIPYGTLNAYNVRVMYISRQCKNLKKVICDPCASCV